MTVVRGFAAYLATLDPSAEVPPASLLPGGTHRAVPYLYSPADIVALLAQAEKLKTPLRRATIQTLIGLMTVTGLFSGVTGRGAVRASCLRSSEADGMTLACAAGVAQAPDAACHPWRGVALSCAMSSRLAAPGRGEVLVAFFELETQVDGLLFEVGDLLAEGIDVGGDAEPGLAPGLLTERLGQAFLELPDAGVEPD